MVTWCYHLAEVVEGPATRTQLGLSITLERASDLICTTIASLRNIHVPSLYGHSSLVHVKLSVISR